MTRVCSQVLFAAREKITRPRELALDIADCLSRLPICDLVNTEAPRSAACLRHVVQRRQHTAAKSAGRRKDPRRGVLMRFR
jgi:hypothetical protein